MRSKISKIFVKSGNYFDINTVHFLNKECFTRALGNITNIQKLCKKEVKPNPFIKNKFNNAYKLKENVNLSGYLLLSIPIGTFMLGIWQIQRRKWKLDVIEKLNSRIKQEPIELPKNLEKVETMEYCPIKARGTFIYEKEFFVGLKSLITNDRTVNNNVLVGPKESKIGYHVITPFKLVDRDLTILVNRGWIPKSHKYTVTKQKNQIKDETEIIGIIRVSESRPQFSPKNAVNTDIWYYRDLNAMAKKADADPIYVEMVANKNSSEYPIGGQTIVQLRNEHLNYIITWFSLSIATGYMWYKKFMKSRIAY